MDATALRNLVGPQHEEEAAALLNEKGNFSTKISLRNPKVTLVLAIFLGMFAIDRLYQGGVKLFLCKLAMLALTLGVWWIVDIGYSIKSTQEMNYRKIVGQV